MLIGTGCRIPEGQLTRPASVGRQVIKTAGAVIRNMDYRGCYVDVQASNVTFVDCLFDTIAGYFTIRQYGGFSGLVVEFCTFDGLKRSTGAGACVLSDDGVAYVKDNIFTGIPADAAQLVGGVFTRNSVSSIGWASGAHADCISVRRTTSPLTISNNELNARWDNSPAVPNNCVRITTEAGPTSNVNVVTNVMVGGTYQVSVPSTATAVSVCGNSMDRGAYGALYPTGLPADLTFARNVEYGTGYAI